MDFHGEIAFTGRRDDGLVNEIIRHMEPAYVWGVTLHILRNADLLLVTDVINGFKG